MVSRNGLVKAQDLVNRRFAKVTIQRAIENGDITRIARGVYAAKNAHLPEHVLLAIASMKMPLAAVGLISALHFHGVTAPKTNAVWMVVSNKAKTPRFDYPEVRLVRMSGLSLSEGIELKLTDGLPIRITNPAKTIADCFKFRSTIGIDVAFDALRDAWQKQKFNAEQIAFYAAINRVTNAMKPFLASIGCEVVDVSKQIEVRKLQIANQNDLLDFSCV